MAKFRVKFSLYGKGMQTEVEAYSRIAAMTQIKEKIVFHEISEVEEHKVGKDLDFDAFKDVFGGIFK